MLSLALLIDKKSKRRNAYVFTQKTHRTAYAIFANKLCFAKNYFAAFSHFWFATPQEVLQADWQEVWHSPQPPFFLLSLRSRVFKVVILFIVYDSFC